MAHRTFTDAGGCRWEMWDVVPQWTERRSGQDRRVQTQRIGPAYDRRFRAERRRALTDSRLRLRISAGLESGWLCFKSHGERRRLAPIPQGWEEASATELESLCCTARRMSWGPEVARHKEETV